jgi:hypothetical protein
MHLIGSLNPTRVSSRDEGEEGVGAGVDLTVWERQGLPQSAQMRLRTASVDSAKLVWEVASACACASSTLRSCTPQSPHRRDNPAIACLLLASDRRNLGVGGKSRKVLLAKRFGATLGALKSSALWGKGVFTGWISETGSHSPYRFIRRFNFLKLYYMVCRV